MGRHAKVIAGLTFTMPDAPLDQAERPQSASQPQGVGLPVAHGCQSLLLAAASISHLATGTSSGEETG